MNFCSPRVTLTIQCLAWVPYPVTALVSEKFLVISKVNEEKERKGDNETVCDPGFLFFKNMMPYVYIHVHSSIYSP